MAKASSRRWRALLSGGVAALLMPSPLAAQADPAGLLRGGGRTALARLETRSAYWNRHDEYDSRIVAMLNLNTSLNLDPEMHIVDARTVDGLSRFPFIYAHSIAELNAAERRNFGEYLRRGGFFFVNACRHSGVNPDFEYFVENQIRTLKPEFPALRIEVLRLNHPLFSVYFPIRAVAVDPSFRPHPDPLRAVYDGDRMIGVINLLGLQCAWGRMMNSPYRLEIYVSQSIKMFANIYVYAMTRL